MIHSYFTYKHYVIISHRNNFQSCFWHRIESLFQLRITSSFIIHYLLLAYYIATNMYCVHTVFDILKEHSSIYEVHSISCKR